VSRYTGENYRAWHAAAEGSAKAIVPLVLELVKPRSVIDIGCGTGSWLAVFRESGVDDVIGVDDDVDRDLLTIPHETFLARDLSQPLALDRSFDLALSLEVAEHLPESSAEWFIESLTALAPVVLFSAAIPGQGGVHHVNEQWPEYWAERFARKGYVPVDCLRRKVWANEAVDWWYAQNMIVYVERAHLEGEPALKREFDFSGTGQLSVVHPQKYLLLRQWALDHHDES
jgi:SAM-dependent methyltransferase